MLVTVFVAGAILRFGLGLPTSSSRSSWARSWPPPTPSPWSPPSGRCKAPGAPAHHRGEREPVQRRHRPRGLRRDPGRHPARAASRPPRGLVQLVWVTAVGIGIGAAAGWGAAQLMRLPTTTSWRSCSPSSSPTARGWPPKPCTPLPSWRWWRRGSPWAASGWRELTPAGKVAIRSFWAVAAFGINSVAVPHHRPAVRFRGLRRRRHRHRLGSARPHRGTRGRGLPDPVLLHPQARPPSRGPGSTSWSGGT